MERKTGFVVFITGPSGSGKSSLAEALSFRFPRSIVVSQDSFYRRDLGVGESFEDSSSFDWSALRAEVSRARLSHSLVLLEGLCLLHGLAQHETDAVVLLECDRDLALRRRLARDAEIPKQDASANSETYFDQHVWPAHLKYLQHICDNKIRVDLLLSASASLKDLVEKAEKKLRQMMKERQELE